MSKKCQKRNSTKVFHDAVIMIVIYQCFLLLDQFQDMMNKHLTYFEEKFKAELEKREEILNEKIKSLEDEVMRGKSRLSFIDLPCVSSIK